MSDLPPAAVVWLSQAAAVRRRLLGWYRRHRRAMPWRGIRDPYRIWVSEVMLQQTQVATAEPYYRAFIRRFPTVRRLAAAPRDEVLAAWAGLGYYRRARHLHEAAGIVVAEHAGRVPAEPEAFGRLPGVGRYTAGAVMSIAFDHPLPVLDGNVARVLSRLAMLPHSAREPAGARVLWTLAGALVTRRAPGDWNQALMELGAQVCLPRAPRCGGCPLAAHCRALAAGRVGEFPPVARRRPLERVRRAVAVIERDGRRLLARRSGRLLDGLWEPPGLDLADGVAAGAALRGLLRGLGVRARLRDTGRRVRHGITHREIEVEVWGGELLGPPPRRPDLRWERPGGGRLALTALARKLARD